MKKLLALAALVLMAPLGRSADAPAPATAPAPAPTRSEVLANRILDSSGVAALIPQNFETGLKPFLARMKAQGMPEELVTSIHGEATRFFEENFKWEDIKPLIVKLYTDSFTEAELADLAAFYETPTGRKAASLLPSLSAKGMALGMSRIQDKMPDFQKRVGALITDYTKKQAAEKAAAEKAAADKAAADKAAQAPAAPAPAAATPAGGK